MKIVAPKPFTYRGGSRAVLLLHGFTGTAFHVRKLGKYLHEHGYTCHAPVYKGHGVDPKQLLQTGPEDWWQNVIDGYNFLKAEGYSDIAAAGLSMGGVFSLKLAAEKPVKGIVTMSAPIIKKEVSDLYRRVESYAKEFKKFQGKDNAQITNELKELNEMPTTSLENLAQTINGLRERLDSVTAPIFVLQGCLDESPYLESAQMIYDNVGSERKELKWYEQSGHVITLDKEREQVYEDIGEFLDSLDW
ncbi:carboxylesterase [Pueribacillus theae]|uniref:Carboxylesterase n=1 Tax=Pueribacillus theae TaxID=2171751 RepID=A0A2U1K848_9BACI|nr:carboxylesterase [Pueribacillus theae]PWA13243.1 carboxylesterase [Pueribacillus theae]